jgi:hypothetical protein
VVLSQREEGADEERERYHGLTSWSRNFHRVV